VELSTGKHATRKKILRRSSVAKVANMPRMRSRGKKLEHLQRDASR
jgi:hypothetical protein